MVRRLAPALAASLLLIAVACAGEQPESATGNTSAAKQSISLQPEIEAARKTYEPEALSYLEAALDTIEVHHIHGPDYDWEELRLVVLERAEGAEEPSETYNAIRFALQDLGERHGSFQAPADNSSHSTETERRADENRRPTPELLQLALKRVEDNIVRLVVPPFMGQDQKRTTAYATALQKHIRQADRAGTCGWIVDVRGNGGGNMWPMIAGLGPLLGGRKVGAIYKRGRLLDTWIYEDGQAKLDSIVLARVEDNPYVLTNDTPPVAVLTDRQTGSSGEAVVVAFRGRENTRSFGEATGGAPTQPGHFVLSDGAHLVFSVQQMTDRTGKAYNGPIAPDVETSGPVVEAVEWLIEEGCDDS